MSPRQKKRKLFKWHMKRNKGALTGLYMTQNGLGLTTRQQLKLNLGWKAHFDMDAWFDLKAPRNFRIDIDLDCILK